MYLQNENLEVINVLNLKAEIKNLVEASSAEDLEAITEKDVMNGLKDWYNQSNDLFANSLQDEQKNNLKIGVFGKRKLWRKLKKHLCNVLKEDSTFDEILEEILKAVSSLIPGGVIIRIFLERLVKYIFKKGYANLCEI